MTRSNNANRGDVVARTYEFGYDNRQRRVRVDRKELLRVAKLVLEDERVASATVGVVLVGNAEMQQINRDFLGHDYPTDVISFVHSAEVAGEVGSGGKGKRRGAGLILEGDLVLGAEYAAETALEYGWSTNEELALYLAHGLLHLCGYDDLVPAEKRVMRRRERQVLALAGLTPPYRRRG